MRTLIRLVVSSLSLNLLTACQQPTIAEAFSTDDAGTSPKALENRAKDLYLAGVTLQKIEPHQALEAFEEALRIAPDGTEIKRKAEVARERLRVAIRDGGS